MAANTLLQLLTFFSAAFLLFQAATAQTSYANEFVDPDFIVAGDFPANTGGAQDTITVWATELAKQGPWSVTSKQAVPPSGTKHDYMSWAPYEWPNCSNVTNSTTLSDVEVWEQCIYENRDGLFNPDVRTVINDVGNFQNMSDAILYNTLAWSFDRSSNTFGKNAVRFIQTWFLDDETRMNPNLNYAQMIRGPAGRPGSPTGVLDLHGMAKIASAILILRKAKSREWTTQLDDKMIAWSKEYITWLETADLALAEGDATKCVSAAVSKFF